MLNITNQHQTTLIKVYTFFRLISASVLLAVAALNAAVSDGDILNNWVYLSLNLAYFILCFSLSIYTAKQHYNLKVQHTFTAILTDQAFLVYLIYANIHTSNNFDILLITPICMAAILFKGSLATFFAASATLGLFAVHFYTAIHELTNFSDTERLSLFGFIFFSASLVIQYMSKRLREAEQRVEKSDWQAQKLSLLNNQIVKRIRTGVMIFDDNNRLVLSNPAAENLIRGTAFQINAQVLKGLQQWRKNHQQPPPQENIKYNFSELDNNGHTIVFLEDLIEVSQHAQQLKLASLGKLTASIAHELRNPLSAISYANQLLLDSDALDETDKELINTSEANANRINHIIEDILSASKESKGIPDKINLTAFANQLKHEYLISRPNAQLCLEYDERLMFVAPFDRNQLRQIFVNLIDNGLRHSVAFSNIPTITLSFELQSEGVALITFTDQGQGVDPALEHRLFEPFFTTEKTGTGLGLYLSKELCTLNQANLSYEPNDNSNGATFKISFSHPNRDILRNTLDTH